VALGFFWWRQQEVVSPLLHAGIPFNLGSADQPREIVVPAVAILIAPIALALRLAIDSQSGAAAAVRRHGADASVGARTDVRSRARSGGAIP